jgi:ribose transport system substrate-binding protein
MNSPVKIGRGALVAVLVGAATIAASATSGASAKSVKAVAHAPSWCGPKKITLALADGFGDNNWRLLTRGEAYNEALRCPSVTKYVYQNAHGNTQQAISQIKSLAAEGVNAMVVFPDAGQTVLPAITSAYHAGPVVVPYRVFPGGKAGTNYNYFITTNFTQAGVLWAKFMVKALHGKGNIMNLGGPPANSQSLQEYQGMQTVFKNHPGIHFVGQTPYNVTNWDPAQTEKVVTALLAKYPKIDGVTTDFGAALADSFGAFKRASRKIPAVATEDSNLLSCDWKSLHASDPKFVLETVDSQTWMVRTAIDFAVAKASGGRIPSSNVVPQFEFENQLTGKPHAPVCASALPPTTLLSTHLSAPQAKAALGGNFPPSLFKKVVALHSILKGLH